MDDIWWGDELDVTGARLLLDSIDELSDETGLSEALLTDVLVMAELVELPPPDEEPPQAARPVHNTSNQHNL
jgi:hypothetical protein